MSAHQNTPSRPHMRTGLIAAGALAFTAAGLAACGAEGSLERPAPLFGASAQRQYEADRAAGRRSGSSELDAAAPKGTVAAGSSDKDDNAPKTTRDIQDPAQKLTPLSASPIEGPPNPLGSPVSTRPPG